MKAFLDIIIRAASRSPSIGHLSDAQRDFLLSDHFRELIRFEGDVGRENKLNIIRYILQVTALRPDADVMSCINKGFIHLDLFGVAMPIHTLDIALTPAEQRELALAAETNLKSKMVKAARLTQKARSRHTQDELFVRTLAANKAKSLPFCSAADYKENPEYARTRDEENRKIVNVYADRVRHNRQVRRARISNVACPGVANWLMFLRNIALDVLAPSAK